MLWNKNPLAIVDASRNRKNLMLGTLNVLLAVSAMVKHDSPQMYCPSFTYGHAAHKAKRQIMRRSVTCRLNVTASRHQALSRAWKTLTCLNCHTPLSAIDAFRCSRPHSPLCAGKNMATIMTAAAIRSATVFSIVRCTISSCFCKS